ncbi:oligosaccharide flippase family protein [Phenylobacterium sp.]|uniref:oligosaccharide flippase family protein n=1 Tax=Phenylobacterium sp. TaxID=1871053 RepID=UPI002CD5A065|nr:oligosaccharide flippase family protein [Phenylobacterium sp.]HVI31070.1 oligosaccharide flippase family protein [Phenylobacterium sp.]
MSRFLLKLVAADRLGYAALQAVLMQVAAVLINFLTGVITARVLGAEGRGVYAAATAWAMLLGSASTVGLADAVLIRIRQRPEASRAIALCGLVAALAVATALSLLAFASMPLLLGRRAEASLDLARASLVLAHVGAVGVIVRQVYAGQGRYLAANLSAFLPTALHAAVLLGVLAMGRLEVATAVASVLAGSALAVGLVLPSLLRQLQGPLSELRRAARDLMDFARRAVFADLFALCATWTDRLLLIFLLGPAQLGAYVVAASLAQRITAFTPRTSLLLSAMSGEGPAEAAQLHHLALRVTIASCLPVLAVLFLVDTLLITSVYGAEFASAVLVFRILVVDRVLARFAAIASQLYLALGRPGLNSCFRGAELGVMVAVMIILTPDHGAAGAACGLLAGTGVRLALAWGGLVTQLRLPFPRLWLTRQDLAGMKAALE